MTKPPPLELVETNEEEGDEEDVENALSPPKHVVSYAQDIYFFKAMLCCGCN